MYYSSLYSLILINAVVLHALISHDAFDIGKIDCSYRNLTDKESIGTNRPQLQLLHYKVL